MTAIGSRMRAQLEEKIQRLDAYGRGFQNLVGSPFKEVCRGPSGLACAQLSSPGMIGW